MRDGNELVGWGMATGIWEACQLTASARAITLRANGNGEIASATADIGPGHLHDDDPARRRECSALPA